MRIGTVFLAMAGINLLASDPIAARYLPFQGVFRDQRGELISTNQAVRFQLFEVASGGQAVWKGEMHRLTINQGVGNTILGTMNAFPRWADTTETRDFFERTLYLEITVDANGDGDFRDNTDPPLRPRQTVYPSAFASRAQDASRLKGASREELAPVGTITAFAGRTVPVGWLPCDGTERPIEAYPRLHATIQNTFGTAPPGRFRLPTFPAAPATNDLTYLIKH